MMKPIPREGGSHAHHTEVLVAGGGLAGLSAAAFLAWHGVAVTLVERHPGTLIHPRARSINPRTAELLRQLGMAEAVTSEHGYESARPAVQMLRAETLAGPELSRTEQRPPADSAGGQQVSPSNWGMIDQDRLEQALRRRAEELGAEIRFGQELRGLRQDDQGVTAVVRRPDGSTTRVRAAYLVGADGHASRVRQAIGARLDGPGVISHVASMVFDADLTGPLRGRHDPEQGRFIASCHLSTPAEGTVLFPHGLTHRWVLNTPFFPERGESVADFDEARCVEVVRAAAGVPDLAVALVPQLSDGTTVLGYAVGAGVADRYRQGRVLLAGDAAHVMPPSGAFGAGTGIQDAHNLAWKLAAVLRGTASPRLLDSYQDERRPVAEFTLGQALLLLNLRGASPVPPPVGHELVEYDAVVFGYRYRSAAIVGDAGGDGHAADEGEKALPPRLLAGQPGTRAPHFVPSGTGVGSSLDLYGPGAVLLVGSDGDAWTTAAAALPRPSGPPLRVHRLDTAAAAELHGISGTGAVLVRPDGFVAWRSHDDKVPPSALALALGRALHGAAAA